jgi:NAD+ synthase
MRVLDYKKLTLDIQSWIENYCKSAYADGIIVGLSGGIDSAVTATLSVNAIGKENVVGLGLPCESLPQDLDDAKSLAEQLGIKFQIVDLTSTFNEFLKVVKPVINPNKISIANIKPRLRMTTIYYVGQSYGGYLVGGTGNRSELAIGYFTKYGDLGIIDEFLN